MKYHREHGWAAAYCPMIRDPDLQLAFKGACHDADIILTEVRGEWINITDTDEKQRKENINEICKLLEYAEKMEAKNLVIHGGTAESGGWGKITPDNFSNVQFQRNVNAIQEILHRVDPKKTKLTMEISAITYPYSAKNYVELKKAVNHPAFGVHLDPFNLLTSPNACLRNKEVLQKCFELLGPSITSCCAKDVLVKNWGNPIEITETIIGEGMTDYGVYLSEISRCGNNPPLMITNVSKKQLLDVNEFLFETCKKLEIPIKHGEFRVKKKKPVLQPLEI